MPDGHRLYYARELPGDAREYVFVDAATGERRPLFDGERLAASLGAALGKALDARHLPLKRIEIEAPSASPASALAFTAGDARWRCDLATYRVERLASSEQTAGHLEEVGATTRTGPATELALVNRSRGTMVVYWMDFSGHRRPYGRVAPGGELRQHTYEGHVWVITDEQDHELASFETPEGGGEIAIHDDGAATLPPSRRQALRAPAPAAAPAHASKAGEGVVASPDGKLEAFVRDHQVFLRDVRTHAETRLTRDGTPKDVYAADDLSFSPDSAHLLAMRTTQGDERRVYLVESSPRDQLQPKLDSYGYLKPGDKVPVQRPRLFDLPSRRPVPIDDALFGNPWELSQVRWAADGKGFTFVYNQRGHQVVRVIGVDARTGAARALVEERSDTFVDYSGKLFFGRLEGSREILWASERDGHNHLYLYDLDTGALKNQVTRGPWVVRRVLRVDPETRQIWFYAGGVRPAEDPYELQLCRVSFDGTGLTVLTEGDGTHSVEFSPGRAYFLDTWSRVDLPPVTALRRASDGHLVAELERADTSALVGTGWTAPERFVAKGRDGTTDIYGIVVRPWDFDPSKKYPVLEQVYAGPQDAFVPKAFELEEDMHHLADRGFVVVMADGMGTSWRSRAFHDVAYKNLADAGFPDRIAWIKAAAAKHPEMDLARVGIYGGSAGGQSAMRALLSHADFYKAAVADSGCHDNRMDKIWWNEQWMGWPVDESYAKSSNVADAHLLQGKLLLMVGELDHNVDPSSTMQVVDALVRADKDFELLVVPGGQHGIAHTPYGKRRLEDFFVRTLGAEAAAPPVEPGSR
jgi:dienelactone hydrolase